MKNEIRRFFKNFRRRIPDEIKKEYDQKIFENIINSEIYKNSKSIFVYLSQKEEINTKKIIKKALEDKKLIYVPKIRKKLIMDAVIINSMDDIIIGDFGIETSKNEITTPNPDLSIVPGLCFDNKKYRIGYGGGYYDYYIKNHKSIYLGLFYSQLRIDEIPIEEFDQKLDYILTEDELF